MSLHVSIHRCSHRGRGVEIRGNMQELILSFNCVGPRDKTQARALILQAVSPSPVLDRTLLCGSGCPANRDVSMSHQKPCLLHILFPWCIEFPPHGVFSSYLVCLCHKIISWADAGCSKHLVCLLRAVLPNQVLWCTISIRHWHLLWARWRPKAQKATVSRSPFPSLNTWKVHVSLAILAIDGTDQTLIEARR